MTEREDIADPFLTWLDNEIEDIVRKRELQPFGSSAYAMYVACAAIVEKCRNQYRRFVMDEK